MSLELRELYESSLFKYHIVKYSSIIAILALTWPVSHMQQQIGRHGVCIKCYLKSNKQLELLTGSCISLIAKLSSALTGRLS